MVIGAKAILHFGTPHRLRRWLKPPVVFKYAIIKLIVIKQVAITIMG